MSNKIDHLNPANWWPHFDVDSDRRAVPAFILWEQPELQGYLHLGEAAAGMEPWRLITGTDMMSLACHKRVVIEFGATAERRVEPDFMVYISNKDFYRLRQEITEAGLTATFEALWALHQARVITRAEFDRRADALRHLRGYYQGLEA